MVTSIWAKRSRCRINVNGEGKTYAPLCIGCMKRIHNVYIHEDCWEDTVREFREGRAKKFQCQMCRGEKLGWAYIEDIEQKRHLRSLFERKIAQLNN